MTEYAETQVHKDRVSIPGIILGIPLFMLGAALMLSILGFPIGVLLFAAGLGLMTTPRGVTRRASTDEFPRSSQSEQASRQPH